MIEEIIYRDDVTVELVKASASDADVIWAARVSTPAQSIAPSFVKGVTIAVRSRPNGGAIVMR